MEKTRPKSAMGATSSASTFLNAFVIMTHFHVIKAPTSMKEVGRRLPLQQRLSPFRLQWETRETHWMQFTECVKMPERRPGKFRYRQHTPDKVRFAAGYCRVNMTGMWW
jgi:hypothetical protein